MEKDFPKDNATRRTNSFIPCRDCGMEIHFDDNIVSRYRCILCSQIISHDKRYTDKKGKPVPLDEKGKNHHNCAAESHGGIQFWS